MKPTKCPAKEKKVRQEPIKFDGLLSEARKVKKRGGKKAKSKSQDSKFCFLRMPELTFCNQKAAKLTSFPR